MTKIILKLFILMTLCVAIFTHTLPPTHAQTSFDCTQVTVVPTIECEALVVLYTSTDGDNWLYDSESISGDVWLQTFDLCQWYGITCTEGYIEQIELERNNLSGFLPPQIGNLSHLKQLILSYNQIESIPPEIGRLTELERLLLGNNQLSTLPTTISNLANLYALHVDTNQLISIPNEIGNMTQLTHLYASSNQIMSLPAEIGNLVNLNRLWIFNNSLTSIPIEIGNLSNLRYLSLSDNLLTSLPAKIGNLVNLKELWLRDNQLTSIPSEIGNLTNLNELIVYSNQITSIPDAVGNLDNLISLNFADNQLTTLPNTLDLPNLQELFLGGNRLETIPTVVWRLTNLTHLHLQENQFSSIHSDISNLENLSSLWLQDNRLTSIPSEIGDLVNLSELRLSSNQLTSIPLEIGTLVTLNELYLYNNRLASVPDQISNLANLTTLSLSRNPLTSFPTTLTNLSNIQDLYLIDLCEPSVSVLQAWLDTIPNIVGRSGVLCSEVEIGGRLWIERDDNRAFGQADIPLDSAEITMVNVVGGQVQTSTLITDSEGRYSINTLPFTTYTLTVVNDSLQSATNTPVIIDPDTTLDGKLVVTLSVANPRFINQNFAYEVAGDIYESNDRCQDATPFSTDGGTHSHTFHDVGDVDWVRFEVEEEVRYSVIANVPLESDADIFTEIHSACDSGVEVEQEHSFATGVRLDFEAHATGTYYLKLFNKRANVFGDDVSYSVSVRKIEQNLAKSAVIIVAGKLYDDDDLQPNIHHVTDNVYKMYRDNDYPESRIHYLATDLTLDPMGTGEIAVDGHATLANLEDAITSWAYNLVDGERALTIYMMSHGDEEQFFLDGEDHFVTPTQLNTWVTALEETVRVRDGSDLKVNIIIDACHSGSFITATETLSKPGRVIIASAEPDELARATRSGALFSDNFTHAMNNNFTLFSAFGHASDATTSYAFPHTPWIDDNGNGIPNEVGDGLVAAIRGFGFSGTFNNQYQWEPYIVESYPVTQEMGNATIEVRVLDDSERTQTTSDDITNVWAVLYAPSYVPPAQDSVELVAEDQPTISLVEANGTYAGQFCPTEAGMWQAVVYAEDGDELVSRPETITFDINEVGECVPPVTLTPTATPVPIVTPEPSATPDVPLAITAVTVDTTSKSSMLWLGLSFILLVSVLSQATRQ